MLQHLAMLFHVTNAIALVECLGLALVLAVWTEKVAGTWLLILFLLGVSLWIAGNELPNWFGPGANAAGLLLLCTAPLASAVFFDFAASFSRFKLPGWVAWGVCAVAAAIGVASAIVGPGSFRYVPALGYLAFPNRMGWIATFSWAGFALVGYVALARAWWLQGERERQQIIAIGAASLLGAFCMCGYGITVLGLPLPPLPLVLLPAYPLSLVYAILRYRVFIANHWAQRGLAWGLLTALGVCVIALVAVLPLGQSGFARLVSGGLVAVVCLGLAGPVRSFALRAVYPGGTAGADDLRHWRASLRTAETLPNMAARAAMILSRRLGMTVDIRIDEAAHGGSEPALLCFATAEGFHTTLTGWDAAPPGPRHLAELFATVLADEADRLARAEALATRERERQTEARLAELGALAATIAHDVRNPLNIIRMAAAGVEPEMRAEISNQVSRISRLASDLLDYAKPWAVTAQDIDAAALLRAVSARFDNIELGPGLHATANLQADPQRLEQALVNLLDNAVAAGHRVLVDIEQLQNSKAIIVADNGPGIPPDIRDRLFTPFVSRSAGGTGLGLAIVARVMAAHGGSVALTSRPGWTTCFSLDFPL